MFQKGEHKRGNRCMEMSHTRLDMYGFTKISFAWIDQYYITEQLTQLDNTHSHAQLPNLSLISINCNMIYISNN